MTGAITSTPQSRALTRGIMDAVGCTRESAHLHIYTISTSTQARELYNARNTRTASPALRMKNKRKKKNLLQA
jgi:hypothetical protein